MSKSNQPFYEQTYRPQFHFTPKENWMNDPNGMVYYEGEYHLFYQYHPHSTVWGPMHWGHAVSRDLVHWEHLPVALAPDEHGMIFSGSAVVDWSDTSGFFDGGSGLVAIYTSADTYPDSERPRQRQSIAYSYDRGRTWTTYEGNPVLSDVNITDFRDPKVFWHEDTSQWVMVIVAGQTVRFYTSPNLKEWNFASEFGENEGSHHGVWECPDLFQLPVEGTEEKKWVLIVSLGDNLDKVEGSKMQYFIGDFDGRTFMNEHSPETILWLDYGRDNYAGVSWSDIPEEDGRRIYIGWMSNWIYANLVPTQAWRSAMSLPRELYLVKKDEGIRLIQKPVRELEKIRSGKVEIAQQVVTEGEQILSEFEGKTVEIIAEFTIGDATEFGLKVLKGKNEETVIGYDVREEAVFINRENAGDASFHEHFAGTHKAPLKPVDKKVQLHLFVDWSSVEVFANGGEVAITDLVFPKENGQQIAVYAKGGQVTIETLQIYPLNSIWQA